MTPDGTRATYARIATADRARLARAQTLIAAGRSDAARAVLAWSAEKMIAGRKEVQKNER